MAYRMLNAYFCIVSGVSHKSPLNWVLFTSLLPRDVRLKGHELTQQQKVGGGEFAGFRVQVRRVVFFLLFHFLFLPFCLGFPGL